MSLGARLKDLRLGKGVSLQTVADAIGFSKPHVWELERGSSKNPSFELIKNLANYYCVSVDFLAGDDEEGDGASPEIKAFARELSSKDLSLNDIEVLRSTAEALSKKGNG